VRAEAQTRVIGFWLALIAAYALCALYAAMVGEMRLDEYAHFTQIQRFRDGDFRILDVLVAAPGYHLVIAALMRIFRADSFSAARVITSAFGFLAVAGFHCLRRDAVGRADFLATAQFAVLPIFLLLVFMVQTDVLSLALVLWSVWAAGRQRHWLAGALLLGAVCVRQNNVLWLVLMVWPSVRDSMRQSGAQRLAGSASTLLPYALVGAAFVAYWIVHGSVSMSPTAALVHPDFSLHSGNLFYLMFVAALLFAWPFVKDWSRFCHAVRERWWLIVLPAGLAFLYLSTFTVDHPFNLLQPPDLRDWLLMRTQASPIWYAAFGAIAVFGGVGLIWQRLLIGNRALFWLVTALFVSLSWLIEQRYYLIPFALFLAWRAPESARVERATLALWAPVAVLFFWGMMTGQLYI